MGLASDLDYVIPTPTWAQRGVQACAATRAGAWAFARLLPPLDRVVARLTRGRTSLPRMLAGLPVLVLGTTGRRSGLPRETFLISVPVVGDALALLGTNFGQAHTPAWVHNLEANPRATVTFRGRIRPVVARAATEAERASVLTGAALIYQGYVKYQERITGRELRIFVLEPAQD